MTQDALSVLVVDDDETMREVLTVRLEDWGYRVRTVGDAAGARAAIAEDDPDVVLADLVLPGMSGIELLRLLKEDDASRPVILMTGHGSVDLAVEAMKDGAEDFLTKPIETEKLEAVLKAVIADLSLRHRVAELDHQLEDQPGFAGMIGRSEAMREVFATVELLAKNEASAIITGASGTGKELVARSIHGLSSRAAGPFVALNCAAIPEGLIESELFGHTKGAFTGATQLRRGAFELADGGVLLLDEIAEMPINLQPKFLRILEDQRVRRLGGSKDIEFDVRVVAATNRPIESAIEDDKLREDLYFRLAVFEVRLPDLKDREGDIPLLVQAFIREFNRKHGTDVEGMRDEALALLERHHWPGNVRELRNVVERATIVAGEGWIETGQLPLFLRAPRDEDDPKLTLEVGETSAAEAERELILRTLEVVGGNKAEAARRLDLDVKTIRNKLKRWEKDTADG
ncbi:MAG TPA: sigma-54-dependent Fis family transcriptional regulator [Alphaproteobacteria bacterium]|nr:sigma-54-dependent Fis family transcriptional regulator [Alphaproteobacteria bacterium]